MPAETLPRILLVDVCAWLAAAGVLVVSGVFALTAGRAQRSGRGARLWLAWTPLLLALAATLAGLTWRALRIAAWPAATPAGALASWGGGALIVSAWLLLRWARWDQDGRPVPPAVALALLGSAVLLAAAGAAAWRVPAVAPVAGATSWLFAALGVLASVGLGGWAPALCGSAWGVWAAGRRGEFPSAAGDAGRAPALFAFPWLTAAILVAVLWSLAAHVTVLETTRGNLWLLAAWLFGAAYLHATSAWRPLHWPAQLATALAGLATASAVMVALNAATLL